MKILASLCLALALAACGATNNAATMSHAMSKTYSFAANSAASAMEQGLVPVEAKACIKAADNIAFGYVNEANEKAQEWVKAGEEEQGVIEQVVNNLSSLMNGSLAEISRIIATKEC